MYRDNAPFKHGDILRHPDGLVGKLFVSPNSPECEVHSLESHHSRWVVRSWTVADLRKAGWRLNYGKI
jgi:hypothetical protein